MGGLQSPDLTARNIDWIAALFPGCITETRGADGRLKRAVNFDLLRQLLSDEAVEGGEAYAFTWVGKKAAIAEANRPARKALRPCPEESVNWDDTENLYIEGENLEALKLLQESHSGRVGIIYIDPPYNTGNDFIYADDFQMTAEEYRAKSGARYGRGDPPAGDTDGGGRFHSAWCSMMYARLMLARNLLAEDGVIFISIDEREAGNLQKICDEVFGERNYAATFLWTKTATPPALSRKCRKTVEYVFAYEKKRNARRYFGAPTDGGDAPLLNTGNPVKTLVFPAGTVRFRFLQNGVIPAGKKDRAEALHDIAVADGVNAGDIRIKGPFKWSQETLLDEVSAGTYFLIKSEKFSVRFQRVRTGRAFKAPTNFLNIELNKAAGVGTNESAAKEMASLGMAGVFDYAKPVSLIRRILEMAGKYDPDAVVMDFFSGSAATAHAVMQMNAEDGGHRRFILVQRPEPCGGKSAAYRAGYRNICEIGRERIRRAARQIAEERPCARFDSGFRVFTLEE